MQYFNHDTDASFDSKVSALRFFHGGAAVDAYWCLIECIYKDEKPFELNDFNAASLAMKLNASLADVQSWVDGIIETGLLSKSENGLTSRRIEENIRAYHEKTKRARENGAKGGRVKASKGLATAKQPLSKGLATAKQPLSKGLANKIKENKEDAELLKAQQSSLLIGSGESQSAAAEADDGSTWDWDEVMRELMLNA